MSWPVAWLRAALMSEHAPDGFRVGIDDGGAARRSVEHAPPGPWCQAEWSYVNCAGVQVCISLYMCLEWDPQKAASNLKKHGVRFADAHSVLEDPQALTINDPDRNEQRHRTVGMDALGRVLVVSYTWRGDLLRIISVRRQPPPSDDSTRAHE